MRASVSMPILRGFAASAAARSKTDLICKACLLQSFALVAGGNRPGAAWLLLIAVAPGAIFFDSSDTRESLVGGIGAVGGLI